MYSEAHDELEEQFDPTLQEARAELWSRGIVSPWYLRADQLDAYLLLRREKDPFIEKARRWGGTTTILTYVLEELLRHPGWVCRWCEPWKNQAREIVMPEIDKIMQTCPDELRFRYQSVDSVYVGPGNSRLFLRGVNEDKGESARGSFANIIVADEYGSWKHASYIINDILVPQLLKQEKAQLIKNSSPAKDLSHTYYDEKRLAIRENRFIQKTIHDNTSLTKEEIEKECQRVGGVESSTWKREYLCQEVADPESLIVPEYTDELVSLPEDYKVPAFFDTYVCGDSGADDNTFILFAYYDFHRDWLVVWDEFVTNNATSKTIVESAKLKEAANWGEKPVYRRIYEAPKQLLIDITVDHNYPVMPPKKDDKTAAIHALRTRIKTGKFKVHERCKQLRWQLKVGMWKDEKHSDFERSEGLGHLDGIASAVYLNRHIDWKRNPYPANYGLSEETHYIGPQPTLPGSTEDVLADIFGTKARGF